MYHFVNFLRGILVKKKEKQSLYPTKSKCTSNRKYLPFPDVKIPEPKRSNLQIYLLFFLLSVVSSVCFLTWRFINLQETLTKSGSLEWWEVCGTFLRFFGEISLTVLAYIQTVYIVWLFWWKQQDGGESFNLEGVRVEKFSESTESKEKVDIIIPCCKEPLQMIKDTVSAVIALDWTALDIFVCDDGEDDDLSEWVAYLNAEVFENIPNSIERTIQYVRRIKSNPHHAKAGNINNCFKNFCSSKYVAIIDADMIIHPSFLVQTIQMFGENVAYVQIPQTYYNIGRTDPWASDAQKRFYYNVQHLALHQWGASECVGTGVVFRQKHLSSIGGFTYGSLTEDTATGLELHKAGFSSSYLPQVLQLGTTPSSLAGQYRQKMRWTLGGLQTFHKSNICLESNLRGFIQKWPYLSIGVHFYAVVFIYLPTVLLSFICFLTDNYFLYFTSVEQVMLFYQLYIPYLFFLSLVTRLQYILFLDGGHVLYHRASSWFLFSLLMPLDALYTNFIKPGLIQFKVTNSEDTVARNTNINNFKKLIPFVFYVTFFLVSIVKTALSMVLETNEKITWEDWLFLSGKIFWASIIIQYTLPIILGVLSSKEYPDHQDLVMRKFDSALGIELPYVKAVSTKL